MVRKIRYETLCNIDFMEHDQEVEANYSQAVRINNKLLHLDWCNECEKRFHINDVIDIFERFGQDPGIELGPPRTTPQARRTDRVMKPQYICPKCGAPYVHKKYYDAHMKAEHEGGQPTFFCQVQECEHHQLPGGFFTPQQRGMHQYQKHGIAGEHSSARRQSRAAAK